MTCLKLVYTLLICSVWEVTKKYQYSLFLEILQTIMISCCLIYAAMAGGHVFLCSVFFSLFGSYIVSWKVKRHLFLSSYGPSISGHESKLRTLQNFSQLFYFPCHHRKVTAPSCCQHASFPPELVIILTQVALSTNYG